MRFNKSIVAIALASSVLGTSSSLAEDADMMGCLRLSKQVASALEANQQSSNYKAATDEESTGRQYCRRGFYAAGIAHYEKALNDLGQQQSKG